MKHIIGKIIIMTACLCLMAFHFSITLECTLAFLVAIIVSYTDFIYISEKPKRYEEEATSVQKRILLSDIISLIYIGVGLFSPPFIAFYPLVSYDIGKFKYKLTPFLLTISCIYFIFTEEPYFSLMVAILSTLGIYIAYICTLISNYENIIITQRDKSVEHDILLEENNRQIIANQDNRIYMATLKERNRIAREIHDNVGHMLTRSILQAGAIKVINKDQKLAEPISNLQDTLTTAMTSIRTSVHDLHDDSIDLKSSIESLANDSESLNISIDYDMSAVIPRDIKYAFIGIIKEAINNTQKHSNGNSMLILLREHPGFYQLIISDNGTDIQINNTGIGLSGMEERIKALNGTLKISVTNGFNIFVSVMKRGGVNNENYYS